MDFTELQLHPDLMAGIRDAGFVHCTPVQAKCLVHTLKSRDVTVQSQTGTGKTAAFLITIFQLILDGKLPAGKKAMVIAPTRELAVQIEKDAQLLGKHLNISMATFFGGVSYGPQEESLSNNVQLMIGTPGRLLDLGQKRRFNFRDVQILVIDEADRLFDMGFLPDIRRMLRQMPPFDKRITMLYSATLSMRVKALAWDHMNNPVEIRIEPEKVTVDAVTQVLYHVGKYEKISLLLGVLAKDKPESAVIFTNTKHAAITVAKRLSLNGYQCSYLIGDMPQSKRLKTVEDAKNGKIHFLVATDVASRGLHIEDLSMVINYDLPEDIENYVHRIGRTARVGKKGKAISLVSPDYVHSLSAIEKYIHMEIPVEWADDDMFVKDETAGMHIRSGLKPRGSHKRSGNSRPRNPKRPAVHQKNRPGRTEGSAKPRKSAPRKPHQHETKLNRNGSPEERLAYYRAKYGENFKLQGDK